MIARADLLLVVTAVLVSAFPSMFPALAQTSTESGKEVREFRFARRSRLFVKVNSAMRAGLYKTRIYLLHLLTAASGTSRTSRDVRLESAKWAKADVD